MSTPINRDNTFTDQSDEEKQYNGKRNDKSTDTLFKPKFKGIEKTHKTKKEHIGKKFHLDQENDSRLANGAAPMDARGLGYGQGPVNNFYNNNYTINYNNYENIT